MIGSKAGLGLGADLRLDGSATIYRLYDVGYTIALDHAADLLGEVTRGRVRPSRLDARAIQIRNPPLFAALQSFDLSIGGRSHRADVSAHIFDFGVCSLHVRVGAPPALTWPEFADFGTALDASSALAAVFERELRSLTERIALAVERPRVAPLSEEYKIFRIDRLHRSNGEASAAQSLPIADLLTDEQLVGLLVGERTRLSTTARRELVPFRFSYYEDDLTVLTWESALVVEPQPDNRDVEYVLEFANAQLLELRMYDYLLDAELPAIYDRAAAVRVRRRPTLSGRFRTVLSDLQARVADVTETIERVENALKVTNDVYLARIYAAALDLFREQAWRRGIERKLGILRETYAMLNTEAQVARAELLEIAIIALIVIELVLGILR
ncbi:MAG TPA: hypothetical protein VLN49_22125 [Gemmatimonadaceae bacterium]|nr:hypothetical protein [Gemmatimonadaceae bacterium]